MATLETISTLPWTGERMVPELAPAQTFWEHVFRYRFALPYVCGRRVVDVACGEGYGAAALLRGGAARVIGVDICHDSCRHAAARYGVDARQGSATDMPVVSGSVDVVVSFETIEHLPSPSDFLAECVRVLAPGGIAIISSPDRDYYRAGAEPNEFHLSEMNRAEFDALLGRRFRRIEMHSQCRLTAPAFSRNGLAAFNSAWLGVNGFWRLRRRALRSYCETDIYEPCVGAVHRADPVSAVLARDGFWAGLLNPLSVRRGSNSAAERALYHVAVCRDPGSAAPLPG